MKNGPELLWKRHLFLLKGSQGKLAGLCGCAYTVLDWHLPHVSLSFFAFSDYTFIILQSICTLCVWHTIHTHTPSSILYLFDFVDKLVPPRVAADCSLSGALLYMLWTTMLTQQTYISQHTFWIVVAQVQLTTNRPWCIMLGPWNRNTWTNCSHDYWLYCHALHFLLWCGTMSAVWKA